MKIDAINTSMPRPVYEPVRPAQDETNPAAQQLKQTEEARQEKESEALKEQREATQSEAEKVTGSVYGNVLASDEDGDTVAAKPQALEALEDGLVFRKDQTEQEVKTTSLKPQEKALQDVAAPKEETAAEKLAKKEAAEEKKDDNAQQSLTGLSAQQLETMYLRGQISRYQYDQEIGRRDNLMQKEETKPGQVPEEDRKEEQAKEDQVNAEKVQKEIQNNNSFAQRMTKLAVGTAEEDIRAEAFKNANENDRVDLMTQIFDQN
ncbi:MAG: hypothetical protein IKS87_09330 [Lachnospiraceae bacterium]|nr:hypothetical protein [Lachnospiraceae bacterium]